MGVVGGGSPQFGCSGRHVRADDSKKVYQLGSQGLRLPWLLFQNTFR